MFRLPTLNYKNFLMRAKDLMSSPPITASKNVCIDEIANLMYQNRIGSVLIIDKEGRLEGIVTERDIIYAVAKRKIGRCFPAYTVMTEDPITVSPDTTLFEAIKLMSSNKIRHLPVATVEGKPIGMLSLRDLLNFVASLMSMLKEARHES